MENIEGFKLTEYSHGAGCGCKISPKILDQILESNLTIPDSKNLIVGNHSKDDAAVYSIGGDRAIISTTDFFMPIVDDPYDFGRIASANAISDIYAMGGDPILAIAILGWPVAKIPAEVAKKVIEGSRSICLEAGIPLAGGHSIDSPEPIFGLSVNGTIEVSNIKTNSGAKNGDLLFLTKPLGVGILTTAEKKGMLSKSDIGLASSQMMVLNKIGTILGGETTVNAMTDVTGFGLLGHLVEMCEGSDVGAEIEFGLIPFIIDDLSYYLDKGCIPGGTIRNWDSYGHKILNKSGADDDRIRNLLADPQTSGGLLVSVRPEGKPNMQRILLENGMHNYLIPIGRVTDEFRGVRIK